MYKILEEVENLVFDDYGDCVTIDYREIGVVMTEDEAKAYVDRYSYEYIHDYDNRLHRGKLSYEEVKVLDIDKDLDEHIKMVEEILEFDKAGLNEWKDCEYAGYVDYINSCKEHLEKLKKIRAILYPLDPFELAQIKEEKK